MTREEAIAFFKDMNECTYGNLEAVEMAIKALEQTELADGDRAISLNAVMTILASRGIDETYIGEQIRQLPSVKPQEPKVGHWVKTPKAVMGEGYMWYCDKCGHQVYQDSSKPYPSEKYCPACGAKMVEPQDIVKRKGTPRENYEPIYNCENWIP